MPQTPAASVATLGMLLCRLGRLNDTLLQGVARRHGTTPAELQVLAVLRQSPDGAASPTEIGSRIVQTSGGLTATLRRLERDGRVAREPDPADGRGRLVALTAAGSAFHDEVFDELIEHYAVRLARTDVEVVLAGVRELVQAFEKAAGVPSSARTGTRRVR